MYIVVKMYYFVDTQIHRPPPGFSGVKSTMESHEGEIFIAVIYILNRILYVLTLDVHMFF